MDDDMEYKKSIETLESLLKEDSHIVVIEEGGNEKGTIWYCSFQFNHIHLAHDFSIILGLEFSRVCSFGAIKIDGYKINENIEHILRLIGQELFDEPKLTYTFQPK